MVVIGFIVTLAFGILGLLACGTIGAACQSDETVEVQNFAFIIFIPALLISTLLLFLPFSMFGSTENHQSNGDEKTA